MKRSSFRTQHEGKKYSQARKYDSSTQFHFDGLLPIRTSAICLHSRMPCLYSRIYCDETTPSMENERNVIGKMIHGVVYINLA